MPDGAWASGFEAHSTNQRMEVSAAFEAVKALPGPLEIRSDSTYVVNCFNKRWHEGWHKRGWLNSAKKPVANRDLWEPFIDLVLSRGDVTFSWVKGHSGDRWNDVVDGLAVEAVTLRHGRSGDRPLGESEVAALPADDVLPRHGRKADASTGDASTGRATATTATAASATGGSAADPRVPAGRKVVVTGVSDDGLAAQEQAVTRRLAEIIRAKYDLDNSTVVLTGLRKGVERVAALAAQTSGVPYVVVLPYPDPSARWPAPERNRFAALLEGADSTVTLERTVPQSAKGRTDSLARRDGWMAACADEAIVVHDGTDPVTAALLRKLERRLGDDVWVVDLAEAR